MSPPKERSGALARQVPANVRSSAHNGTRVPAWGLEIDFCGSQLLAHKLVTGAIADTAIAVISAAVASGVATAITSIVAAITAITSAVSCAVATTITAAVATAVATTTITAAIDTARRRRRRSIDLAARRRSNLAARRRRRRSIDLAARRRRRSIRDGSTGNDRTTGNSEVGCFGFGGNGGGSEREGRREHDGYPA
jgi:hypothetical protein